MFTPGVSVGTTIIEYDAVRRRVGIEVGLAHHDEDVGHRCVRGEPLVAVDDPLVTVADRLGGEHRRVGTRARLGHREARPDLTGEQRLHPPPLLLVGPADRQELGIAGIGGVVAEDPGCQRRLPEDLVHQAELHLAEAAAAELRRQVGGPQAHVAHLLLQWLGDPRRMWPDPSRYGIRGRGSRAGRSRRGRTRASTPASPRTPARSRNPMPCHAPCRRPLGAGHGVARAVATNHAGRRAPCRSPSSGGRGVGAVGISPGAPRSRESPCRLGAHPGGRAPARRGCSS